MEPDDRPRPCAICPSCSRVVASLPPGLERKTVARFTQAWIDMGRAPASLTDAQIRERGWGHASTCGFCPDAGNPPGTPEGGQEARHGAAVGPGGPEGP